MRGLRVGLLLGLAVGGRGQDPLKTLPENYRMVFENASVAVIRAHYGPHQTVAVHDHPSVATVFVYLNDSGSVRINHQEQGGAPETVVRPPTVTGSYRVAPGLAERHSIENPGETSSDFLRVELKGVVLALKEPFRGRAPVGEPRDEDVVEFTNPVVRVERMICEVSPCAVKAEEAGSLVVAFGPVSVSGRTVERGGVFWVRKGEEDLVEADGGGAVHLLRVVLPRS